LYQPALPFCTPNERLDTIEDAWQTKREVIQSALQ